MEKFDTHQKSVTTEFCIRKRSNRKREERREEKRKKKTEENKGNPHPSETPISNLNFLVKERQKKRPLAY